MWPRRLSSLLTTCSHEVRPIPTPRFKVIAQLCSLCRVISVSNSAGAKALPVEEFLQLRVQPLRRRHRRTARGAAGGGAGSGGGASASVDILPLSDDEVASTIVTLAEGLLFLRAFFVFRTRLYRVRSGSVESVAGVSGATTVIKELKAEGGDVWEALKELAGALPGSLTPEEETIVMRVTFGAPLY